MLLILFSVFHILCTPTRGYAKIVTDYECKTKFESSFCPSDGCRFTLEEPNYWLAGFTRLPGVYIDREWTYCRPKDPPFPPSFVASPSAYHNFTTGVMAGDPFNGIENDRRYGLYRLYYKQRSLSSGEQGYPPLPNHFQYKLAAFPTEYQWADSSLCITSAVYTALDGSPPSIDYNFKCGSNGLFYKVTLSIVNGAYKYQFTCCPLVYGSMWTFPDPAPDRLLIGINSVYDSSASSRTIVSNLFGKPMWRTTSVISSTYSLALSRSDLNFWQRICPRNGAFTNIIQQSDKRIAFTCAKLVDSASSAECKWTNYVNEFHSNFNAVCDKYGIVRGMEGYYSISSNDWRIQIYCCDLQPKTYIKQNMEIKIKTSASTGSDSTALLTLILCWDNYLYQGILTLNSLNQWKSTDDVVQYKTCGNERGLTVSTNSADAATISEIGVKIHSTEYIIHTFKAYNGATATTSTNKDEFSLMKNTGAAKLTPNECSNKINFITSWYTGASLDTTNKKWNDLSGNNNHATLIGDVIAQTVAAENELFVNGKPVAFGSKDTKVDFKTEVKKAHTVFNLCKYRDGASTQKSRILQTTTNSLFGFFAGKSGIAHELGWITEEINRFQTNWVLSSQTHSLYRGNRQDFTKQPGPVLTTEIGNLYINNGFAPTETSDWACAEIIVVNQELDLTEIVCIENYFYNKYFPVTTPTSSYVDAVIKFPDDYLTACTGSGCVGSLYPLSKYYLITVDLCPSFTMSGIPKLGVVLRGINGNLDKQIIVGPVFKEVQIGQGDVGKLISINIEHESGPDVCVQKVTIYNPQQKKTEFGKEFVADGVVISTDCTADGAFRLLTGIQYARCYTKIFAIQTYQTSLYTSIQIHSCSGSAGGITAANSDFLSLTVTGLSKSKRFVSTNALSLKSSRDWASSTSRDYTLPIYGEYESISLVSIGNNHLLDALCVDSVLINGVEGYLTNYWVGGSYVKTIAAVRSWPICKTELTTTVTASTKLPMNPSSVATASCVNTNRLLSTKCEISQSFETYEEISWSQDVGEEVSKDITMERATETSVTVDISASETQSQSTSLGLETGISGEVSKVTLSASVSSTSEWGSERSWSTSNSNTDTQSTSVGVTNSVSKMKVTTDGKVNGKTNTIQCSGEVEVPPQHKVVYALLFDQQETKLSTKTDIKMTKCSAYLPGIAKNDPSNYIYVYGIKGILKAKESTNCYVSFGQSTQVNPDPKLLDCGKERALATREWGTYVPQCDKDDAKKYKKCQCAYGDKWTEPTCGCVDETTGNLLPTSKASVVAESDTYKWTQWCTAHCGAGSHSLNSAAETPGIDVVHILSKDEFVDKVSDNVELNVDNYKDYMWIVIGVMVAVATITYVFNSCKSACFESRSAKYQALHQETEVDDNV